MEACRLGRFGIGSDANPLAYALTIAKVDPPAPDEAYTRLTELRVACRLLDPARAPTDIQMLYHPRVLGQLLWLREKLDARKRADRFLLAALLGIMHANFKPGTPARGLSISMPNTFSMSPSYVRRYIEENNLMPPDIDVFQLLERKLSRMHLPDAEAMRGTAWQHDIRDRLPKNLRSDPAKLIFTSPPYLGVISYGKYNWVRLWLLKKEPRQVDRSLVATGSLTKYLAFTKVVLENLHEVLRPDGYLCLMIGDVRERRGGHVTNLAERVWEDVASKVGWYRLAIIADRLPAKHKVSRIWKNNPGRATKTDRILILSRKKPHLRDLPELSPLHWTSPAAWA